MRFYLCVFAVLVAISGSVHADPASEGSNTATDRLAELERAVKKLATDLDKVSKREPKLECRVSNDTGQVSNNPEALVAVPNPEEGWQLVGGGCRFNGWQDKWMPIMLADFPVITPNQTANVWRCWGKNPQGISLSAAAIYCRAVFK
jgi:hypothetical protein